MVGVLSQTPTADIKLNKNQSPDNCQPWIQKGDVKWPKSGMVPKNIKYVLCCKFCYSE